jgi:hypothetical protein
MTGLMIIFSALYYRTPTGSINQAAKASYSKLSPIKQLQLEAYLAFSPFSLAASELLYPYTAVTPPYLTDQAELADLLNELKVTYTNNINGAAQYSHAAGAKFYHFLQPQLFSSNPPTAYEQELSNNPYIVPAGFDIAFIRGYPTLQAAQVDLQKRGVVSLDLSRLFNGNRPNDQEYFLD